MGVIAQRPAHPLQREVRDHLIGVHIRRGAGAALDHVHDEMRMMGAVDDFVADGGDGLGQAARQSAKVAIG